MPRYVALFRGINVGKAKRIDMADLRTLLAKLGYTNVITLLNSGNALFDAKPEPGERHARRIHEAVAKKLGVNASVVVKSRREIATIVEQNALAKIASDPSRLLVAMTQDAGTIAGLRDLARRDWGDEKVHIGRQAAYLWCARGILDSDAAAAVLGALKDSATTRNWTTLGKIHASLSAGPETDGS
jgi:uncharacterized protein (DUF1697 family)